MEIYQLKIFDVTTKSWLDKSTLEFILPEDPFAEGIV